MDQVQPERHLYHQTANYTAIIACGSCQDLLSCTHYQVLDFYLTNQRTGRRVGRRYTCFRCSYDFDAVSRLVEHLFTVHFVACRLLCRYCFPYAGVAGLQAYESISQLACHFRYNHQEPQWDTDFVALWVNGQRGGYLDWRKRQEGEGENGNYSAQQQLIGNSQRGYANNYHYSSQQMQLHQREFRNCYCCCCCS